MALQPAVYSRNGCDSGLATKGGKVASNNNNNNIRFLGRPDLFSTDLETGRRRGNSYCRGAAAAELECTDELLASLLTDNVSTSVLPSAGDSQQRKRFKLKEHRMQTKTNAVRL